MPDRAMLLCVLAACSALARADRHVLVVAHSAVAGRAPLLESTADESTEPDPVVDDADPDEGSLDYQALDNWRTEATGQVDRVVAAERDKLDPAATEGIDAAEKYATMLSSLGHGFDTFRSAVDDFRAANKDLQGRQNDEVREVLQSARVESGNTVNATETAVESGEPVDKAVQHEVEPEEEAAPLSGSVVGSEATANVTETPVEPAVASSERLNKATEPEERAVPREHHASPRSESVVGSTAAAHSSANFTAKDLEDLSHEADKLTGHAENEATEEDAVESSSVVRKETSKKARDAVGGLEEALKSGNITDDAGATQEAVQELVDEEEAQQARVTTACFALSDSPLKSKGRKCNSEAVKGMFEEKVCEGHGDDLQAICDSTSKCQTKHVCIKDGEVVLDADGGWEVRDGPACEADGASAVVCVPRAGGFRLPPAA